MNINSNSGAGRVAVFAMLTALAGTAGAQAPASGTGAAAPAADKGAARPDTSSRAAKQEETAKRHVSEAVAVVRSIEKDQRMRSVLQQSKGVFIVPSYGRAALGVGASGGTGILLVRRPDGQWSHPVFYNTGGLNVGLQAGAEGGAMALVLMNDKAVTEFTKRNNFSMNAKTGLTILNWTRIAQGELGTGDVVAWSGAKGLFGDIVTIELNNIRFNQNLTNAYYQRSLSVSDVVEGKASNSQAEPLIEELAGATKTPE